MKCNYLNVRLLFALFLAIFIMIACKNSGGKGNKSDQNLNSEQTEKAVVDNNMIRGEAVYSEVCGICHQEDGSGVPMMFPPLIKSDIINGDHVKLIKIILEGMKGPLVVKGEQYDNEMPPQNNLSDQQISDLLTYLRKSFGNSADPISVEEVSKSRN